MVDRQRFRELCKETADASIHRDSIGTLGEKALHAVLKQYFEPDIKKHEIRVGSYIADIAADNNIIEIQTRAFNKLRGKLTEFLSISPVTVVYPLPDTKWVLWIDILTGEVSKRRKSPKRGGIYDAIPELYRIKPFLSHPAIRLCIVLIDVEEYRYLNGWSEDKKRGSTRCDRIPLDITEELWFSSTKDYCRFIPPGLHDQFTSRDLSNIAGISIRSAQTTLNILHHLGVVRRTGKQSNMYVYQRTI